MPQQLAFICELGGIPFYSLNDMFQVHSFMAGFSEVGSPACVGLDTKSLTLLAGSNGRPGSRICTNASEGSVSLRPSPSRYGWNPGQALATF